MTHPLTFPANTAVPTLGRADIIGPHSAWPRKPRRFARRAAIAGSVGSVAVFVHCVVPMIA